MTEYEELECFTTRINTDLDGLFELQVEFLQKGMQIMEYDDDQADQRRREVLEACESFIDGVIKKEEFIERKSQTLPALIARLKLLDDQESVSIARWHTRKRRLDTSELGLVLNNLLKDALEEGIKTNTEGKGVIQRRLKDGCLLEFSMVPKQAERYFSHDGASAVRFFEDVCTINRMRAEREAAGKFAMTTAQIVRETTRTKDGTTQRPTKATEKRMIDELLLMRQSSFAIYEPNDPDSDGDMMLIQTRLLIPGGLEFEPVFRAGNTTYKNVWVMEAAPETEAINGAWDYPLLDIDRPIKDNEIGLQTITERVFAECLTKVARKSKKAGRYYAVHVKDEKTGKPTAWPNPIYKELRLDTIAEKLNRDIDRSKKRNDLAYSVRDFFNAQAREWAEGNGRANGVKVYAWAEIVGECRGSSKNAAYKMRFFFTCDPAQKSIMEKRHKC